MSWPLKSLFQHVKESNFSAEEAELIMSFESLGDNCEFGLVQRLIGRERLSLLRYAGVGDVFALARGIAGGLAIFNEPDCIDVSHHAHEWVAGVPALQLSFHTGRNVSNNSLEQVKHDENRKLTYLAQKFIEDCETADKVFVYRVHRDVRGGPDGLRGMEEIYAALRRHGPARLLWVNVEDEAHANGTIEHVREGLYRGWIDHLAPHSNAFDYRPRSWLNLLEHARTCMFT